MGSTGSQKGNFQLADTRLVSIPTSSAIAPTYEHHLEAIAILKDEHDGDIFAWLKLARSLEQSLQPRSDHACLTRDQVRAIAALNHYANDDISAWLHLARAPSRWREHYTLTEDWFSSRHFQKSCLLSLASCPQVASHPRTWSISQLVWYKHIMPSQQFI